MAREQIQWGAITLHLDDETFRKSFSSGRSMYFDDSECDTPHIAHHMSTLDAVSSVADENSSGGYHFDRMVFSGPFDILGFFLGYMSGPIIEESSEERKERQSHIVTLLEETCPTGVAL